jgi:hypothetical protein
MSRFSSHPVYDDRLSSKQTDAHALSALSSESLSVTFSAPSMNFTHATHRAFQRRARLRGGRGLAWRGLRLPCKGYSHRPAPTPLSQRVQLRTVRRSLRCLAYWRFTQRLHLYYTAKMVILPWPSEWPSRFLHQPRLGLACLKYSSRSRQHSVVFEGGMSQQLLCVA